MQKTFTKYIIIILTAAISLILFLNFLINLHTLESRQYDTFYIKTDQMIHTLENNSMELRLLNESLDEDYLTRARAAAYVLDHQQEVSLNVSEMQYLADLLNVDELHVIDENGIIAAGSVSQYVGIDMADHKQTRAFLAILESDDPDAFLIQETQPNAAENKIMKYIGVARKGEKGVVQVGLQPIRQLEAQSRNTYDYIFSRFPTDREEELYVVDASTGEILGHSGGTARNFDAECYRLASLDRCAKGSYLPGTDGNMMYVVSRQYGDVLLCAALPQRILLQKLWGSFLESLFYMLSIGLAVILLLNWLVRQKVISGIHHIIEDLGRITNGSLDTKVSVGGNPEFEALSQGINTMVTSIVSLSDRISAIIEISGIPLAAFEYKHGGTHVFATSGLCTLLDLPVQEAAALYQDADRFDRYIRAITETPIEGEDDIYRIGSSRYIRIHMSGSSESRLGIILDVTKDIRQKRQMHYENTHDALTGLYRFGYFKQLAEDLLHKMPAGNICAVVMLDLDHFKSINDTYGHDTGDRYLQCFSALMASMPPEHVLSARRSGDEFCMLLHGCSEKAELYDLLDRFYEALARSRVTVSDTQNLTIGASGGFAWTRDPESSLAELLHNADESLYIVKRDTKGRYTEYDRQT